MDADELELVIDDLYAVAPEDFVPLRAERSKQAKAAGDKDAAAAIAALRRPTTGAWLVNVLVRHHGEQVEALIELAASMRAAQDELDGDQLRALTTQRGQLVAAMARQARALAHDLGRVVSSGVVEEVEQTLRAALADPGAAAEVRAGRLTTGLTYAGLGGTGGLGGVGSGGGAVPIGAAGAGRGRTPAPRPPGERPVPGRPPAAADRPLRAVPRASDADGGSQGRDADVVPLVTRAEREQAEREREAARRAREREREAARAAWHRAQDDEARLRRGHEATQAAARAGTARLEQARRRVQQAEAELAGATQEQLDADAAVVRQEQDVVAAAEATVAAEAATRAAADRLRSLEEDRLEED